jgi:hypothetical protein
VKVLPVGMSMNIRNFDMEVWKVESKTRRRVKYSLMGIIPIYSFHKEVPSLKLLYTVQITELPEIKFSSAYL